MNSGIYQILNKVNGKFYIGSAFNFTERWYKHRSLLRYSKHPNEYLQSAWNIHKESNFKFQILEYYGKSALIEREQFWLDWTQAYNKKTGYNISKTANNDRKGILHTEQSKLKMSLSKKGISQDPIIAQQRNISNRKLELWPCLKGCYCDCRKCKDTENIQQRKRREMKSIKQFFAQKELTE